MAEESTTMCKILVVDDTPDFRNTLSGSLTDAGHTVRSAANEGEALDAVIQESFDFALIDVRLHDGGEEDESGLSLAMAVRSLDPKVRIILMTGYKVKVKQVVRAIRYHGAVDFIEKTPDIGAQILKTITEAHKETKRLKFERTSDATQLSLSFTVGQPLVLRAYGHYVCSTRTSNVLRMAIERYARRTELARKDVSDWRFQVKGIGCDLWRDIFAEHPEAERAYIEARAKSRSLSLLFETPREFLRVPLEFICSETPPEYLILQHPIARFVHDATPKRGAISPSTLALTKRLRVLIIASNTQPQIDGVDAEAQALYKYLQRQEFIPISVRLIPTEHATYEHVREELRKGSYDIIHYAGHGSYNGASPEESNLYFWTDKNKQGAVVPMKASELKMLLERSEARLVYLSSCYGTTTGAQAALLDDDFLGLADAVVQAGVPSVLGFRWPVSDDGARRLALAFYRSLLEQGSPETALWSARCELATINRSDTTWLSPILIHMGHGIAQSIRRVLEPEPSQSSRADEIITRTLSKMQSPTFEPSWECEIAFALEPRDRISMRGRGNLHFTDTSAGFLDLDPVRFMRWGGQQITKSADQRRLLKEKGRELYRLLFEQHLSMSNRYHQALGTVAKGPHLRLAFETTRALVGLPLEFLFSDEAGEYLVLLHSIVRRIRGLVTQRDPVSAELIRHLASSGEKLRVLLLVSNTEPRIDLIDRIGEELVDLLSPVNWLDLTHIRTEAATYSAVQRMLRGCKHHIVHYVGHGDFLEGSPEQSSLFFWEGNNRSGNVKPMNGNQLRFLLQDSDTRLFHLTCCEGTRTGSQVDLLDNDYLGIADGIIQSGVPSVLGYRWPVSAVSAKEMALAFYRSILRHGSPEFALLDARRELAMRNKDDLTWASPILIVQS